MRTDPSREMRRRARLFGLLKREALAADSADDRLYWVSAAATFAWSYHFGLWRDDELEAAVEGLAREAAPGDTAAPRPGEVVHLTSTFSGAGGHAEGLLIWTGLRGAAVVSSEWEPSDTSGLGLPAHLCPPGLTPSERVAWLCAALARLRPEMVVLHILPNDVLALVAALAYRRAAGARVLAHDHADTSFWLGAGLVDRVVVCFPSRVPLARVLRRVEPEKISHVPLTSRTRGSAPVAREALGVPPGATLSLTVAAYYKMRPSGHWDYARALSRVMAEHPNHYHLIVGHGRGERELRGRLDSERVLWLGRRTDVDALLGAADFVVESFPLMGGLFRLDAMREGVPVVAISHPACPEIFDTGAFPADYPLLASSNEEIVRLCARLIRDAAFRGEVGEALRRRFAEHFSEGAVARALDDALKGVPADEPAGAQAYAPEVLAPVLMLSRPSLLAALNTAATALDYKPRMRGAFALRYKAAYAVEAVRHRLRGLRRRAED